MGEILGGIFLLTMCVLKALDRKDTHTDLKYFYFFVWDLGLSVILFDSGDFIPALFAGIYFF